ncbi:spermine/spermidine synthase domain-containing protein [Gimesia panareensis]|uniref:Spermidine synthase n=1 Tax=Gimesia panareensis TaxID=2527978 RepID=A0A517QDV2_9PLAN|nr:hypothetical protein [Gimesia panareensis]QDT29808.1 spermidine synthase [Gimesia panareensis]QDU52801.1 spermidine synthase [Gimesia panareensis]
MIRSFAQNLLKTTLSFAQTRLGFSFLAGWICGLFLLACIQRFQTLVGDGLAVATGVGLTVAMGIWLGFPARASSQPANSSEKTFRKQDQLRTYLMMALLAIWSFCFPLLLWQFNQILHLISLQQLSNPVFLTGLMILSAMALLLPVVFWSARLCWFSVKISLTQQTGAGRQLISPLARYLAGMTLALMMAACWLVPALGWNASLAIAAGIALFSCISPWLGDLAKQFLPGCVTWLKSATVQISQEPTTTVKVPRTQRNISNLLLISSYLVSLAIGVLTVVISRAVFQLFPDSLYLKITVWASLIAGVAAALAWIEARSCARVSQLASRLTVGAALVGAGTLALFPLLVNWMLYANAYIEFVSLLSLVRCGLLSVLFAPLGFCWGGWLRLSITRQATAATETPVYRLPVWQPFCLLAGLFCGSSLIGTLHVDLKLVSLLTTGALACLALLIWGVQFRIPRTRWQAISLGCAVVLLAVSLSGYDNYDSRRSTKLLFSTNTFTGLRYGLKPELLPYMDEGRCLSEVEGQHGTFTVWSYHENQLQIRRSGLPVGVTTTDAGLCPHTTGELMPFVIPAVLHDRPADVLFLGLGSGVSLNSSLDFPVQHITCLEHDPSLVQMYQQEIATRNSISAFDSERVRLIQSPVALAMAARTENKTGYDLIISNPVQSVVAQSQSEYTADFYRNVSRHLKEGGIFCQRFQHIDFGAQPLRVIARTFLTEFKQVMAIEIANGETLFLATNSEQGFVRQGLIDRIQAPQVRSTLAQVGWDWSVLLNLAAYSDESLQQMVADVPTSVNSAATGTFAFTLPYEMMRWGLKREEVKQMVSRDQRTERLINWMHEEQDDPIVLRRLSEVTAQNKLMVQYPDQFWKYRKPAKEQITDNPRSLIRQVAAEAANEDDFIHNEDKRRMLYFKALSDAMAKPSPSMELISRVSRFSSIYDPMITYFMHDEVAELYRKSKEAPPILEFAHRLHAINYGAGSDRSINSVVRAMELAATKPELFQESGQQWDHLNGLLQALKARWDNRSQAPPVTSKQALHDIELSISAIEQAFETMDEIHEIAGVTEREWSLRKKVLDRTLVRPLETYHERVLPHHYKQDKKNRQERKKLLDNLNLPQVPAL